MEVTVRIPDCKADCDHVDCAYGAITGALADHQERTRESWTLVEIGDNKGD